MLLMLLLQQTDDDGFISYEDIEKGFIKAGLEPKENTRGMRKRIFNTRDEIFLRFGLPKKFNGVDLIKTVDEKGLKLYNPKIKVEK